MSIRRLVLLMLGLGLAAGPVLADTDYRCLSQCVSNGRTGSVCLPACTYNAPATVAPKTTPATGVTSSTVGIVSNHRLLPQTRFLDTSTVLVQPKKPDINESKDYRCIAQCLQANMRYQMCEENCVVVTTKAGTKLISGTDTPAVLPFDRTKQP